MIRILPDILSNQIAAGEVVQRPASVVKELVENSIDAGASRITIEIENGGKTLIRVSDNGSGLPRDQALLAIERYATSKIYTQADLSAIHTFGFRGEALPSIASVSRFCLVTRPKAADTATRVEMAGGKLMQVSDTGAPAGTLVEVKHLFFNTPARRKFLKADATEAGHITDTLSGMALGNPAVGFRLVAGGRLVRHFPPGQDRLHRAALVLGKEAADQLYPLNHDTGTVHITGVCANPAMTRATSGRIYLFVNRRLVHDSGVVAAVFRGYAGRIMKGRFPVAVVCCDLPCDQVDVNVHPSKAGNQVSGSPAGIPGSGSGRGQRPFHGPAAGGHLCRIRPRAGRQDPGGARQAPDVLKPCVSGGPGPAPVGGSGRGRF
jgi:DNA mismatch repair protein MutL